MNGKGLVTAEPTVPTRTLARVSPPETCRTTAARRGLWKPGTHLLITAKRNVSCCERWNLFGVGKKALGQLSLVEPGDRAYFVDGTDIVGPYEITSDVYFDNSFTWPKHGKDDVFPFSTDFRTCNKRTRF